MGPITIYGRNAMHWGVTIWLSGREEYLCFRLPFTSHGYWWPLYCYLSPNATPWAASRWFWGREAKGYGKDSITRNVQRSSEGEK